MKNKTKVIILLITTLIISVVIIEKDFKKNSISTIPQSDYVEVTTNTTNNELVKSNESTINWKICRNEEYGYEFKVPSKWSIYERVVDSGLTERDTCEMLSKKSIEITSLQTVTPNSSSPEFSLSVKNRSDFEGKILPGVADIFEYYKNFQHLNRFIGAENYINKEIEIDGERAMWTKFSTDNMFSINVDFSHKSTLFLIRTEYLSIELTEAILSTFRFLD